MERIYLQAMRTKFVLLAMLVLSIALASCTRPPGLQAVIRTQPQSGRGPYPLEVTFDASASHGEAISRYVWDLGKRENGHHEGAAEGMIVRHTYTVPGKYTVYLTVRDETGNTAQTSRTIDVRSLPPVARFEVPTLNAGTVPAKRRVEFDASASYDPDGSVEWYHWDFGDGSAIVSTRQPTVSHTYTMVGWTTVRLIVEDDFGDESPPETLTFQVLAPCCGG